MARACHGPAKVFCCKAFGAKRGRMIGTHTRLPANDPTMQAMNAAQMAELSTMGNVDPAALFAQQQGLMAPVKEKGQNDLMRDLYRKGMLGLANDQQAGGGQTWANAPGTRSNPLAAAHYAAQAGADNKAAFDAINQASNLRTASANRVATLGAQRGQAQTIAKAGQAPAKGASGFTGMLSGLLGNKGVTDALGGVLKGFGGPGAGGANTSAGYGPNAGPQMLQMQPQIQPQFGMDDFYTGGNFDFGSLFGSDSWGGGDLGYSLDLGGGNEWFGNYE